MLMLLVDLVAERVKQDPIPVGLLSVLTMVFDSLMQFLMFGYLAFHIYAASFSNYIEVGVYCLTICSHCLLQIFNIHYAIHKGASVAKNF